jgi:hypothetical protein
MALSSCPDCGTRVSTSAHECPKCGCPFEVAAGKGKRRAAKAPAPAAAPAGNSFASASLVVGVLGVVVCWVPAVGFFVGLLGAFLAAVGFLAALVRGGKGLGYAVAGGLLSAVALTMGLAAGLLALGIANEAAKQQDRGVLVQPSP